MKSEIWKLIWSDKYNEEVKRSLFEEELEDSSIFSEDSLKRIDNFIESNMEIYPCIDEKEYKCFSHKEEETIQRNIILEKKADCSCEDNFYRKIDCKHIWAVRLNIKNGSLPKKNEDREEWYINKLRNIKSDLSKEPKRISEHVIRKINNRGLDDEKIIHVSKFIRKFSQL